MEPFPELQNLILNHCRNCILRLEPIASIHRSTSPPHCSSCIKFACIQKALRETREQLSSSFTSNP